MSNITGEPLHARVADRCFAFDEMSQMYSFGTTDPKQLQSYCGGAKEFELVCTLINDPGGLCERMGAAPEGEWRSKSKIPYLVVEARRILKSTGWSLDAAKYALEYPLPPPPTNKASPIEPQAKRNCTESAEPPPGAAAEADEPILQTCRAGGRPAPHCTASLLLYYPPDQPSQSTVIANSPSELGRASERGGRGLSIGYLRRFYASSFHASSWR